LKFLAESLQFAMHPQAERVDVRRIEDPLDVRERRHDPGGAMLTGCPEPVQHFCFRDRQRCAIGVQRPEEVRDLHQPVRHEAI
jgi:hypothetical protein